MEYSQFLLAIHWELVQAVNTQNRPSDEVIENSRGVPCDPARRIDSGGFVTLSRHFTGDSMAENAETKTVETKKRRDWPAGVSGLLAFGFGMIVTQIEGAGWGVTAAIIGGALAVFVSIYAARMTTE